MRGLEMILAKLPILSLRTVYFYLIFPSISIADGLIVVFLYFSNHAFMALCEN